MLKKLLLLLALVVIVLPITVAVLPGFPDKPTVKAASKPIQIALTFDDGPDPTYTPRMLSLLKKYNAHATFFMVGSRATQYPDLVKSVAASGNEIGAHSMTHAHPKDLSDTKNDYEFTKSVMLLRELSGQKVHYFRPPYMAMSPIYDKKAALLGVTIVTCTLDSGDWTGASSDKIAEKVLSSLEPGSIVLLHDGIGNSDQTLAAAEVILQKAAERGYKSVTLSELGI